MSMWWLRLRDLLDRDHAARETRAGAGGQAKPGDTLFVHGASGAVGTAAVQMARGLGMTVIGSAGTDKGKQLVLDQGAHHAVDHTRDGYIEEVREVTGGAGPNLRRE